MEQRRLRLGDIVDDYCPRERRVTNHAVVAMVEEDVKQTRCTTCDTEHPYKGGKAPRRRKKDTTGSLYKEVLAGLTDADAPATPPALTAPVSVPVPVPVPPPVAATEGPAALHAANGNGRGALQTHAVTAVEEPEPPPAALAEGPVEDGPVHRPLIRATLPRLEGHKEERKATDFTIRQASGRGGQQFQNTRGADQNRGRPRPGQGGQGQPSNRPHGAGARFAGARPGQQTRGASSGRPQGGGGFRGGQAQGRGNGNGNANGNSAHGGGGRKRSR